MIDRIEKVLVDAGLGGIFLVNPHSEYPNLAQVTHNAKRGSSAHEHEDMHNAAKALRDNGFDADITGLILIVRSARSLRFPPEELA